MPDTPQATKPDETTHFLTKEEYPASVVRHTPEGVPPGSPPQIDIVKFGNRFTVYDSMDTETDTYPSEQEASEDTPDGGYVVDEYTENPPPEWFTFYGFGVKQVRTDGWRAHEEVTYGEHLTVIADGWVTGMPDETTQHKTVAIDFTTKLQSGTLISPVPFYWTFSVSSNVFSTMSSILVNDDDVEAFEEWLTDVGFPPDDLARSFQ